MSERYPSLPRGEMIEMRTFQIVSVVSAILTGVFLLATIVLGFWDHDFDSQAPRQGGDDGQPAIERNYQP